MLEGDLLEYVILPASSGPEESDNSYRWTHGDTLALLALYETYRKQVGTLQIKSIKKMFEEISKEMKCKTGKNITPTHCENRWRVLERAYKKYILNVNKTGSARKEFEYADVMHKILGKKKNIHPEILLSTDTVDTPAENEVVLHNDIPTTSNQQVQHTSTIKPASKKEYKNKTLKCQLLKDIRLDRQRYYEKRLAQEEKKIEEKIRKNNLLEERNKILKDIGNRIHPLTEDLLQEFVE